MELTATQLAIAAVIIAAVFSTIGAWLGNVAGVAQAFTNAGKLLANIQTAVLEAEKLYNASDADKYKYVAEIATDTAKDLGLPANEAFIQLLIEGTVKLYHRSAGTVYSGDKAN